MAWTWGAASLGFGGLTQLGDEGVCRQRGGCDEDQREYDFVQGEAILVWLRSSYESAATAGWFLRPRPISHQFANQLGDIGKA